MIKNLFRAYIETITARPKLTLSIAAVIIIVCTIPAKDIILDNDFRKMVFQGVDDVSFMDRHTEVFGPDDTALLILLDRGDTPLPKFATFVEELGNQFEEFEETLRVSSLTHTSVIQSKDDELIISPAFGSKSLIIGDDALRLQQMRESAGARNLIAKEDDKGFILSVTLKEEFKVAQKVVKPANRLQEVTEAAIIKSGLPITANFAGIPFTRVASIEGMRKDLGRLLPIVYLLVGLMIYWQFRRKHAVLLPLISIASSCAVTAGIAALIGEAITPLSVVYPILLLVIGTGDALHFLVRYHEERLSGKDYREAAIETGVSVGGACFLTSFTSAIGFASLCLTDMPILHGFGILNAIGIMVAFITLLTIIPAGLSLSDSPPVPLSPLVVKGLERPLKFITLPKVSLGLAIFGVLLCIFCAYTSRNLNINYTFTKLLQESHPITIGNAEIDKRFSGISTVSVNLQGDEDSFKRPEILKKVDESITFLDQEIGVERSFSISSVVKELNNEVRNENAIPDSQQAIAQLLLLAESSGSSILERVVTDDYAEAQIIFSVRDQGGIVLAEKCDRTQAHLNELFKGTGITPKITGIALLSAKGFNALVGKLIESLLAALVVIVFSLGIVFGSIRTAIASALPNVLPLLIAVGFFGVTGIALELMPSVMFCVAIGIAVDDTIHLIARFREEFKGVNLAEAIRESVVHSLGAVVNTSVILIVGFSTLIFSSFPANRTAGILGAAIVAVALLADLLFVPAVLTVIYTRKPK